MKMENTGIQMCAPHAINSMILSSLEVFVVFIFVLNLKEANRS